MGKLGISIYPDLTKFDQDKAYLDLAHSYGFKRVFTSLLEIEGDQKEVLDNFKGIIKHANSLGMEVMVDINPNLFGRLGISYDDLSFFADLGAWGIRLDLGFTGIEEARMTRNPYGLKIEINMSSGTNYLDNIMSYSPNPENLLGSHNFYPMRYSGLSLDHFLQTTEKFTQNNINTMAFINSQGAEFGPWPYNDGLVTLEMHRDLSLANQIQHLKLLGGIDDIIIANCYASEEELIEASRVFNQLKPTLRVVTGAEITENERKCLFEIDHNYRGDRSAYMLRSTLTRIIFRDSAFYPHDNGRDIKRGDILIGNDLFGQYKGETQIALAPMDNSGEKNIVGHIYKDDLFLLEYLKPWTDFDFEEVLN
ncbi:MupG family TIM beta-alpha barrel fold protein [Streptococcaceae bacterium ESL0729]|nr:MupG family TIM beta-alpha barrel fold protein [Streptococcaceae bacterium ESL0729]